MQKIILIILLLINIKVYAQEITESYTKNIIIESVILSQKRTLTIFLPRDYSRNKKYPVSYVLDSENLFEDHKNIVKYLSDKNIIPKMIVVGIVNENRSFDMTHEKDSTTNFLPNGGGHKFESFICEELIPFIDSSYSTAPYRLLTGYSVSGLFSTKILLHSPSLFNAFLIIDPSLWWNNFEIFSNIKSRLDQLEETDKKLYFSIANSIPSNISEDEALRDTSNATLGYRSVIKFNEELKKIKTDKFTWKSEYYKNERHGTIPLISTYNGLKFIFDFYQNPGFQNISNESPKILISHYKSLSKHLGYEILPPVNILRGLSWRCLVLDKNYDMAFKFLKIYANLYPKDPMVYNQLGQYFNETGNPEKAKENHQRELSLKNMEQTNSTED